MPTLIADYQKKVTVEKLKTAYSTLNQAVSLSENYNGPVSDWKFDADFFDNYILPYMNTVNKKAVFSPTLPYSTKTIDGNNCRGGQLRVLNNGVGFLPLIGGENTIQQYAWIFIDINGLKGPNKLGRDVFATELYRNKKLVMGWGSGDRNGIINESNYGCKKDLATAYYAGFNCGALIMQDGWQISEDYPW